MFGLKKKRITTETMDEYLQLLDKWENQWEIMSRSDARRFIKLEKIVKNKWNN